MPRHRPRRMPPVGVPSETAAAAPLSRSVQPTIASATANSLSSPVFAQFVSNRAPENRGDGSSILPLTTSCESGLAGPWCMIWFRPRFASMRPRDKSGGLARLWDCFDEPILAVSEPDTTIRGGAHRFVTTDAGRRTDTVDAVPICVPTQLVRPRVAPQIRESGRPLSGGWPPLIASATSGAEQSRFRTR